MSHIIYIYIYSSIGLFEVLKTKGKFLDGFALNFCMALWNIYIYFESVSFFNEQGYIFFYDKISILFFPNHLNVLIMIQ